MKIEWTLGMTRGGSSMDGTRKDWMEFNSKQLGWIYLFLDIEDRDHINQMSFSRGGTVCLERDGSIVGTVKH